MMKKCDIVLANVPKTEHRAPYLATFLLKAVIQKYGFTCRSFDWNRDLYEKTKDDDAYYHSDTPFLSKKKFDDMWDKRIKDICVDWMKDLKECDPKWFGISFMSKKHLYMGKKILKLVRLQLPHIKIVVGGFYVGTLGCELGLELKKKGLIDYFVNGEGEEAIINLLNDNYEFPGINNSVVKTPPIDLNLNPTPDYSDVTSFDYTKYYNYSSRGCPNKCIFCTENQYFRKYKFRKAELVAEDFLNIQASTGVSTFAFTDSLINGNPKQFRKFCELLKGKSLNWNGYFVCNEWMTKKDYENAAEAGMSGIYVGVESGSEKIRKDMGKGFSDKDVYKTIEYATESGIKVFPLIIIGWPTETEEDFSETLNFITRLTTYENIGIINPGTTLLLGPEMKAFSKYSINRPFGNKWSFNDNTYEVRKKRWIRLVDHCKSLGLEVSESHRDRVEEKYDDIV